MEKERLRVKATSNQFVNLISKAQKSITMEAYSYVPAGALQDAIRQKRQVEGIPMLLTTNKFVCSGEEVERAHNSSLTGWTTSGGSLVIRGFPPSLRPTDAWEMTPAGSEFYIHAKTISVDSKHAMVGSHNIGPLSLKHNIESAVVVRNCPEFAKLVAGGSSDVARNRVKAPDKPSCSMPLTDFLTDFRNAVVGDYL
jgi:phosphatidylserine/phosphatidylglycerophosphate/cardiolipin synthase-like enzyme